MRVVAACLTILTLGCGPTASPRGPGAVETGTARVRSAALERLPQPVADAFGRLDRELSATDREEIRASRPEDMIRYHFGLGMYIRNEYGLWKGGALYDWFLARDVRHPDDMSAVLLDAYRLYLRGEQVRMDSLIAAAPAPPEQETPPAPDSTLSTLMDVPVDAQHWVGSRYG